MIVVGFDPGTAGAVAFVSHRSAQVHDIPSEEMPGSGRTRRKVYARGLAELLRTQVPRDEPVLVVLEDVHVMPSGKSGGNANTSLMHTKGIIEGVLGALRLEVNLVNSRTWQRFFGLGSKSHEDTDAMRKSRALECARTLWPALAGNALKLAKHHNRAESLLIAQWGLRNLA